MIWNMESKSFYAFKVKFRTDSEKELLFGTQRRNADFISQNMCGKLILIRREQRSIRLKFWDENVKFFLMIWLDLNSSVTVCICFMDVLDLDHSINYITVFRILDLNIDWNEFSEKIVWIVTKCELKLLLCWRNFDRYLISSSRNNLCLFWFIKLNQLIFLFFMIHVRTQLNVNDWSICCFFDQDYFFKY